MLPHADRHMAGAGVCGIYGGAAWLWRNTATGANRTYPVDGLAITGNAAVSVLMDQDWQLVNADRFKPFM
jgi:hypothetical protein